MDELNRTDIAAENNLPAYLFHQGTNFTAYEYLGAHAERTEGGWRYSFRVWAPNARAVSLRADFTDWENGRALERLNEQGIWETTVTTERPLDGQFYKYAVTGQNGETHLKADPYAFFSETLEKTASIVWEIGGYAWHDDEWLKK